MPAVEYHLGGYLVCRWNIAVTGKRHRSHIVPFQVAEKFPDGDNTIEISVISSRVMQYQIAAFRITVSYAAELRKH
jgi:hypothetical protein